MRLTRGTTAAVALVLGLALSGCGEDTPALPDVPDVTVPKVNIPQIPTELPDPKVDAKAAGKLLCDAGDAWFSANAAQRKVIEPPLRRAIGHYRGSSDESIKNLAIAADALVTANQATREAAAAAFRKQCAKSN
ncbi:hypothetical protein [Kribbella deserti]|uniref:Uncharacterized protein n=1 Tax=Kribbella deserti TaxID=1926257 RepID=A0ABV6QVH5_9ACTN